MIAEWVWSGLTIAAGFDTSSDITLGNSVARWGNVRRHYLWFVVMALRCTAVAYNVLPPRHAIPVPRYSLGATGIRRGWRSIRRHYPVVIAKRPKNNTADMIRPLPTTRGHSAPAMPTGIFPLGTGSWAVAGSDGVTIWFVDNATQTWRLRIPRPLRHAIPRDIALGTGNWNGGLRLTALPSGSLN